MKQHFDCIVIGAGIAGITASIYLKRAGLKILLLEKKAIGGQIINTSEIENYPTINNIDGASFAIQLQEQIKKLEIPVQYKEVIDIELDNDLKIIKTKEEEYTTKNIITYQVENYTISGDNKGRQTLENIGSGTGWYITEGYAVPITWEKSSRSSKTIYKYKDGNEIKVNDGNTYIQIQPTGQTFTIE